MSLSAEIQAMINSLESSLSDADKFSGGNDAAGARVRKQLMETKTTCDLLRKSIQKERNARKG